MNRSLAAALVLPILAAACAPLAAPIPAGGRQSLTVFAAASLTDAFTAIGSAFEQQNSGVVVKFAFAGSQALRTQIQDGAPADVFASASPAEMAALVDAGAVAPGAAQKFLSNKLVVIMPPDNPAGIRQLQDLARPGVKLVLAAEAVPAGQYARQSIARMSSAFGSDFQTRLMANVVSNEDNVKQVVGKVQLGEADAAIVYASDAVAAPKLLTLAIPPEMNVIAEYPIAPMARSANKALADRFIAFVLSPAGQALLQQWGFAPVSQ